MTHDAVVEQWAHFRRILKASRKLLEQFPEDQLNYRPHPEARSAAEIIGHTYAMIPQAVNTAASGQPAQSEEPHSFSSKAEMLTWTDAQLEAAFAAFEKLTPAQLNRTIGAGGMEFAAWQWLDFTYQEHLHHRGQLTTYLRMLNIVPNSIYDF